MKNFLPVYFYLESFNPYGAWEIIKMTILRIYDTGEEESSSTGKIDSTYLMRKTPLLNILNRLGQRGWPRWSAMAKLEVGPKLCLKFYYDKI